MQVIELNGFGAPEVMRLAQRPDPVPAAEEVLIRVAASGINRPDVMQRKGHYPPPVGASDVPGLEVAGEIVAGDVPAMQSAGLAVGDQVCALLTGGGYAQLCTAHVGCCLPVPRGCTLTEAAALPETAFTVWSTVFDRARLQPGEVLLVHGGSSGIGVMAIQMAKAMGARVLVTAGSDEKCQRCLELGAELAVNYRTQDFVAEALRHTDQKGVQVILDMVAGPYVQRNIAALADDGRLVTIAVQGGAVAELNMAQVLMRRLTITGATLRARSPAFKREIACQLREHVWPLIERGTIRPVIHQVFAPAQAVQAHQMMERSGHIGKLVLDWQQGENV